MQAPLVLPKLRKLNTDRPKKKKILLLSDDLRFHSGIATMSKELVLSTVEHFDWVQLGAALKHPDENKIFDISDEVEKATGLTDCSVKIYCSTGYGSPDTLRELIHLEKPDAILHFTDPRFWEWLYLIEDEIRSLHQIPLLYWNIWDDAPAPYWNKPYYKSCDLIMNISRQTDNLVKMVLGDSNRELDSYSGDGTVTTHIPHGINSNIFYPIDEGHPEWEEFSAIRKNFKEGNDCDFVIFWNNRNIRRKQPGDVLLAYRVFCDSLPKEQADRCVLFMKTQIRDVNGTDLIAVKQKVCPNYKVVFNEEAVPAKVLNYFYNMADVTLNIASNEGFGLSSAESVMAGTPIVNNVTGGLQDHMRFEDDKGKWIEFTPEFTTNHNGTYKVCGEWAKPVFPSNRSLQGSIPTPYIFDDRCRFEDVAEALLYWYNVPFEERERRGMEGRTWLMSEESGMSSSEMGKRFIKAVDSVMEKWKPKSQFVLSEVKESKISEIGIVW